MPRYTPGSNLNGLFWGPLVDDFKRLPSSYNLTIETQINQLKSGQKIWTHNALKKTYKWQVREEMGKICSH